MTGGWHYKLGGQEFGPVGDDELRSLLKQGEIGSRTPVRSKSLEAWTPIGTLAEFSESAATAEAQVERIPIPEEVFAPIWRRGIAFAVDLLAIWVSGFLLSAIMGIVLAVLAIRGIAGDSPAFNADFSIARFVLVVFPWFYFTIFEGSFLQATPGKLLMRIIVVDASGYRPGFPRAALRSAAKYVSCGVFLLGFVMASFTERKQALHDFVARTVVQKD